MPTKHSDGESDGTTSRAGVLCTAVWSLAMEMFCMPGFDPVCCFKLQTAWVRFVFTKKHANNKASPPGPCLLYLMFLWLVSLVQILQKHVRVDHWCAMAASMTAIPLLVRPHPGLCHRIFWIWKPIKNRQGVTIFKCAAISRETCVGRLAASGSRRACAPGELFCFEQRRVTIRGYFVVFWDSCVRSRAMLHMALQVQSSHPS